MPRPAHASPNAVPSGPYPKPPPPVGPPLLDKETAGPKGTRAPNTVPHSRPAKARPAQSRPRAWFAGLIGRLRDAAEALGSPRAGRLLHEFADLVESARQPEAIEAALVRLAGELSSACRVELHLHRDGQATLAPKSIAVWPEHARDDSAAKVEALGYPLCLGLWCGEHYQMTLELYAKPGRGGRWPRRVVRKLTTLCAMAAAAERGLQAGRRAKTETPVEVSASVRDATFLNAILPYALSQAKRHREPLTILCIEIDKLSALGQSHGLDVSERAVRRVSEAVAKTLRGSDVVARLDDDRTIVVLPNTGGAGALTVATVVRSAVTGVCSASACVPEITASVGVAWFPEDGQEMIALLAAADEAVTRARAKGRNQVATYSTPVAQPAAEPAPRVAEVG